MKYLKLFENINAYQELLDKLSKFKTDKEISLKDTQLLKLNNKEIKTINFKVNHTYLSNGLFFDPLNNGSIGQKNKNRNLYSIKFNKKENYICYLDLIKLEDDYYQSILNIMSENDISHSFSYEEFKENSIRHCYMLDQFIEFKKFFEILNNYFNKL